MYGMVNKAIEELVTERFGREAWGRISEKAGVAGIGFVRSRAYDDAITYGLVAAVAAETGLSAQVILDEFGQHWVLRTAKEGYGSLLEAQGDTFSEFMSNLPNLHTRIVLLMPGITPPHFQVQDLGPNSLTLHYASSRPGLAPFVIGLIKGVGQLYAIVVSIEHVPSADPAKIQDIFKVRW